MTARVVISADSHTERFLDLSEYIDPKHRPKMDELNKRDEERLLKILENMRNRGQETSYSGRKNTMEEFRITVDLGDRMDAITSDGVCAEVVIERGGSRDPDVDFLRACNSAYYRWFNEHFADEAYRFIGVAAITIGDIDKGIEELKEAHDLGFRALILPGSHYWFPGALPFHDRAYDPLWATVQEMGIPILFHPGFGRENPILPADPDGQVFKYGPLTTLELRAALKHFLLGGIAERFPTLNFGWVESGSLWVPPLLDEYDALVKRRPGGQSQELLPSELFARQGFCAGPLTQSEVEARHRLGIDNLMFGTDYPHPEGTYPHTQSMIDEMFEGVSAEETDKILATNAARVFNLDIGRLTSSTVAVG
ncbi:MAG: amidohydrolase [Dehalococcoidia bacterium]|nr:amidohydrolase [Dehalococcoidia bacterium]